MSELSPSEILTAAAKLLRERAAATEPDVMALRGVAWHAEECDRDRCACIVAQGAQFPADYVQPGRYIADAETPELAAWIALMHPGVGLVLADWLDSLTGIEFSEHGPMPDEMVHALAVARQLLGGES